jgi:predicted alpha/beta hydrolase family esterase
MSTTLIIPGLKSSGPTHWQTWLENRVAGSVRVTQRDWNDPHLPDWAGRVRRAITGAAGPVFIAAHSFGALAAVQAASDHAGRIGGVLLVAPADPEHFGVAEFLPMKPLGFPAIIVASTNDPWISFESAARWAELWGADLINAGAAGHINAEAGFGPWPQALALIERLRRAAEFRTAAERLQSLSLSLVRPARRHLLPRRRLHGFADSHVEQFDVRKAAAFLQAEGWSVRPPSEVAKHSRVAQA